MAITFGTVEERSGRFFNCTKRTPMKVQYASQLIAQGICLLSEGLTDPSCVLSEKFNLRPITARLYSTSVGSRLEDFMWPSHSNGVKCTRQSVRPSVSRINPCELL